MNNPFSGLLILVGLLLQSPFFGLMALFGAVCSNLFAVLFGLDGGLYRSGLFGYNGVLVGCCLATFDNATTDDWNANLLASVAFCSVLSTIIFVALGNYLVGPYGVTPLTLPFNLATAMVLLSSHQLNNVKMDLYTSLASAEVLHDAAVDWSRVMEAVIKGYGQVFLADNTLSGVLVMLGMAVCSPISLVMAGLGSLVGTLLGVGLGADLEGVYAGLWGYNALLGCAGVGGFFFILSPKTAFMALFCAAVCAWAGAAMATLLAPAGIIVLTLPFCLATLPFLLLQTSMTQMRPVPITSLTVPEDHYRRYHVGTEIIVIFR
jgi:urea transporter